MMVTVGIGEILSIYGLGMLMIHALQPFLKRIGKTE